MGEALTKWGSEFLAGAVLSIGGYMFRLAYRLEVLERVFKDKKEMLNDVVATSASHEKRLAVMETIIVDLKELTPALRNIATLTGKVETLLETSMQRLDRLEDRVFKQTS